MNNYGFLKTCVSTPSVKTGDIEYNESNIIKEIEKANEQGVKVLFFPRLALTTPNALDLFKFDTFLNKVDASFNKIIKATKQKDMIVFIGSTLRAYNKLFDCMFVLNNGEIQAAIPNNYLSNTDKKYFDYFNNTEEFVSYLNFEIPINENLLIETFSSKANIGIDFSKNFIETSFLSDNGANIIANVFNFKESVSLSQDLTNNIMSISSLNKTCNILVNSNPNAYGDGSVLSGIKVISECGDTLGQLDTFSDKTSLIADIDLDKINTLRNNEEYSFSQDFDIVTIPLDESSSKLNREIDPLPFVTITKQKAPLISDIMAFSLYKKIKDINAKKIVLGVSGGLDSTLALLIIKYMCNKYNMDKDILLPVTLSGLHSSDRTKNNAKKLIENLGFNVLDISIKNAVLSHFKDIGHSGQEDLAYENAQARERTQILMDLANMHNGIMVGTSDMSEEALGFSTFGGDAISMYNILCGLPKTAVKELTLHFSTLNEFKDVKDILVDVVATPISPELKSEQKTEDILGSYDIHDFILYNMVGYKYSKEKTLFLLEKAFKNVDKNILKNCLKTFSEKLVMQQFKRISAPASVKIFDIYLSPKDFNIPLDASRNLLI